MEAQRETFTSCTPHCKPRFTLLFLCYSHHCRLEWLLTAFQYAVAHFVFAFGILTTFLFLQKEKRHKKLCSHFREQTCTRTVSVPSSSPHLPAHLFCTDQLGCQYIQAWCTEMRHSVAFKLQEDHNLRRLKNNTRNRGKELKLLLLLPQNQQR